MVHSGNALGYQLIHLFFKLVHLESDVLNALAALPQPVGVKAFSGQRLDQLEHRLAEVDVDGERAYVLAEDLEELAAVKPTTVVRLLPGFDQFVLGPGTWDGHVVPTSRRAAVSRQSGWISPVVVVGGVVCGTWELDGDQVRVAWFGEAGRPPRNALRAELTRLSSILDRGLRSVIGIA